MKKKDNILIFDLMNKDTVCSHVEANFTTGKVKCVELTDKLYHMVFGKQEHTIDNLLDFLEDRCFSRHRPDVDILLDLLGLKGGYSPLDICRKTHGKTWDDYMWLRFEGEEDYTWDYIKDR